MTLTKRKYRYIGVYISDNLLSNNIDILDKFSNRYLGLFGSIDYNNSHTRIIKINNIDKNIVVLKCKLDNLTNALLTLQLIDLDILVISVSGTLKRLKKRIYEFLKCTFNNSAPFSELTYS